MPAEDVQLFLDKKKPADLEGLRANPIQEELEETGVTLLPAGILVCFILVITDIHERYNAANKQARTAFTVRAWCLFLILRHGFFWYSERILH